MDENNDVIKKLHISASDFFHCSFSNLLPNYNLENKATSNIKIQEVLKKLNLST